MAELIISKSAENISLFISNFVHKKLIEGLSFSSAFLGIVENPENITLCFSRDITAAEETEAKTIVLANSNNDLEVAQYIKIVQINEKTDMLHGGGAPFDGRFFSVDVEARLDWLAMKEFKDVLPWPYTVTDKDGGSYSLELADSDAFFMAVLTFRSQLIASGQVLHGQVMAATTVEEVEAIIDNR